MQGYQLLNAGWAHVDAARTAGAVAMSAGRIGWILIIAAMMVVAGRQVRWIPLLGVLGIIALGAWVYYTAQHSKDVKMAWDTFDAASAAIAPGDRRARASWKDGMDAIGKTFWDL